MQMMRMIERPVVILHFVSISDDTLPFTCLRLAARQEPDLHEPDLKALDHRSRSFTLLRFIEESCALHDDLIRIQCLSKFEKLSTADTQFSWRKKGVFARVRRLKPTRRTVPQVRSRRRLPVCDRSAT